MLVITALTLPAMFAAGLGSSAHCALMCGALGALPLRSHNALPRMQALAWLHAGRVLGYTALGALAGGVGGRIIGLLPDARAGLIVQFIAAILLLAAGLLQLRGARQQQAPCCAAEPRWARHASPPLRLFARGLLWAAMPCGILYGMLALAVFSGGSVSGAALLGAFALGTLPALAAGNFLGATLAAPRHTRILRFAAAALLLGLGLSGLVATLVQTPSISAWCIGRS